MNNFLKKILYPLEAKDYNQIVFIFLLTLLSAVLELLGIVVLGQWSWQNLTTSEKRTAVFDKVQNLKKEYLG